MPESKPWYESITMWGQIMALLGIVFGLFGVTFTSPEQQAAAESVYQIAATVATKDWAGALSAIVGLVSVVMTVAGRKQAVVPVHFLKPFKGTPEDKDVVDKVQAHWLATIVAVALTAFVLAGCASTLKFAADVSGVDVVSESAKQKAYKAAKVAFVAWGGPLCEVGDLKLPSCKAGGVQGLILMYGKLPPCETGIIICRSSKAWPVIKEIERKTTAVLASAKPLIEAGSDDVSLLLSLPEAVFDAQAAIDAAQQGG